MRSFIFLSIFAFAVVRADWSVSLTPEKHETLEIPRFVPEVSVIEEHRDYVVKLDCVGCPLAAKGQDGGNYWKPEQDNALVLHITMEKTNGLDSTLMLNGRRITPLDPMPLEITTWQVPANLTTDAQNQLLLSSPSTQTIPLAIAFEHTMLRTQEGAERMVQFDVTGVVPGDKEEPVKINGEGQKLVQIQLQVNKDTREVSIGHLQVVEREHRAQPFTMKCGRLAMAKTSFNPSEWDTYGKIGSWSRMFSKTFSFLDLQQNPLLLPVALMLGLVAFVGRRWFQRGEQEIRFADDDEANVALLDIDFDNLPPAYANIPIFKIEEYD